MRRAAKVSRARPAPKYGLERASVGSPVPILGSAMPRRKPQDVLVATEIPHAGNDTERDHGWPLWGAAVQAALDRREITVNSAASRLGLRSEAHAMQVADELRGAIGRVHDVVSRAAELAFSDAGARLAGILLADNYRAVRARFRCPVA